MITVVVHQVVFVPSKLVPDFLDYPSDIFFGKFCVSYLDALPKKQDVSLIKIRLKIFQRFIPKSKLLSEFIVFSRVDFKNPTE
jgi:hypothetical protein